LLNLIHRFEILMPELRKIAAVHRMGSLRSDILIQKVPNIKQEF